MKYYRVRAKSAGGAPARWAPVKLLLVEDSPSDAMMTLAALREGRLDYDVWAVTDGEAAVDFLRQTGQFVDAVRPELILLDLNLPRKSGREILAEVKTDSDLKSIPVIVFTTSDAATDILGAYQQHANAFITKPVGLDAFLKAVHGIEDFWLTIARIPEIPAG